MVEPEARYYTRLESFRSLFAEGFPILTYHKFGPAPRGARLRGMHLRPELLDRQLRELRGAGYGPAAVGEFRDHSTGRIALTVDDGFRSVHDRALPVLVRHGFRAMLYLVAEQLGGKNDWEIAEGEVSAPLMTVSEVRSWLAAGQAIGSHTLTHPWLTRIPHRTAREEIVASRRRLEDLFGVAVTDFCYPYGDWDPRVRDLVQEAGYTTAVSTDFGVNSTGADPFALRRVTARYASRGWPWLRAWWRARRRRQATAQST